MADAMMGDYRTNCPACGWHARATDGFQTVRDRYGYDLAMGQCARCAVWFQERPMTDDARRDFYASGQYRRLCAQVTGKPWDYRAFLEDEQWKYGFALSDRLLGCNWRGHLLDFGGSTGAATSWWKGTRTVADYGDGATVTPEAALDVAPGTYDAIICAQTLDHLPEPLDTLRAIHAVAASDAWLFVDVVKREHTDWKIDHETYYPTASSFLRLVEAAGWVPRWLDGTYHPTHWAVLADRG